MRLDEFLTESPLPLGKGGMAHLRSNYGAFICVIAPEDFIRLAVENEEEYQSILSRAAEKLDYQSYKQTPNHQLPFLDIEWDTGKVTGHEGRHRAAMVMAEGGKSFPFCVYPKLRLWRVAYREMYKGLQEEGFDNEAEARARAEELKADPELDLADIQVSRWYMEKLRGHPQRSATWDYSPWRVEDFPNQLVGQYSNYTVPKSRIKIGLVKGYTHFTRP